MEKIVDLISARVSEAFEAAGYDAALGMVTVSNRPDLCQYQCNGAMAAAKQYHKAPFMIAQAVVDQMADDKMFAKVEMSAAAWKRWKSPCPSWWTTADPMWPSPCMSAT